LSQTKQEKIMKKIYTICLLGTVVTTLSLYSETEAGFYVVPVARQAAADFCTGPGEVISAGQCWMDRNLGASQVATSSTDEAAYGDLYQWGRSGDGHQNRSSSVTTDLSANDVPGHSSFIQVSSEPYDWRSPQNHSLWQGLGSVNNPCPQGFRLPTIEEWETEMNSWTSLDAAGAFASPLKLVTSGYRSVQSSEIEYTGERGYYWSSTLDNNIIDDAARRLIFGSTVANVGPSVNYRAGGMSVRCIKN
jgi:uncharacterized protein (TIGR02145 family)